MSFATNRAEHTEFAYFCVLSNLVLTFAIYSLGYPVPLITYALSLAKSAINASFIGVFLLVAYLNLIGGAIFPDLDMKMYADALSNRAILAPTIGNIFLYCFLKRDNKNLVLVFLPLVIYHLQLIFRSFKLVGGHRNSLLHNKFFWFASLTITLFCKNASLVATVGLLSFGAITHLLLDLIGSEICINPRKFIFFMPKLVREYFLMIFCWVGLVSLPFR